MNNEWTWTGGSEFESWEEFRDGYYYPRIVGRPWNGKNYEKPRRGDQSVEQKINDTWREKMGYDAPWTDCNILYDRLKPIALMETKYIDEGMPSAQRSVLEYTARKLDIPLVVLRFDSVEGPIEVRRFDRERK